MDIKSLTEDHAELLISVLEHEIETLEQDCDLELWFPDNSDCHCTEHDQTRIRLDT